jgi:hypothetical protein
MFGDADMKRWAEECMAAMIAHQGHRYDGKLWFPMVDYETAEVTGNSQTVLGGYLAGLLGQVGRRAEGTTSWPATPPCRTTYGIIPESIDVTTRSAADEAHRPAARVRRRLRPGLVRRGAHREDQLAAGHDLVVLQKPGSAACRSG